MANRIVLNTVSYHGKGAIGNIVPELTDGYKRQEQAGGAHGRRDMVRGQGHHRKGL